jgi:hypothetical protein
MVKKETSRIHEESSRLIHLDDRTYFSDRDGDYYRILPTETRNSELSLAGMNKINQSHTSGGNNHPAPPTNALVVVGGEGIRPDNG